MIPLTSLYLLTGYNLSIGYYPGIGYAGMIYESFYSKLLYK